MVGSLLAVVNGKSKRVCGIHFVGISVIIIKNCWAFFIGHRQEKQKAECLDVVAVYRHKKNRIPGVPGVFVCEQCQSHVGAVIAVCEQNEQKSLVLPLRGDICPAKGAVLGREDYCDDAIVEFVALQEAKVWHRWCCH